MAHHLCCSPSSLYNYQPHISSKSLIFSQSTTFHLPNPSILTLTASNLSIEPTPNPPSPSSSKGHIWVNPNRPTNLHKQPSRYSTLLNLSHSLNSSSDAAHVTTLLNSACGNNGFTEQDAVIILNNVKNSETAVFALNYFQNNPTLAKRVILYNVTLKVCKKCRDLDSAEKLFDEMLARGVNPDNITFSTIISCCRVCNLPDRAGYWFEKMAGFGCSPDDVTYSAMIDAYGRAGDVEKALALYDRARTERWRIDVVTFSTLIRIYGKSGNFDGCLNVYEEMKALGVKANLVIYNTLLDAMGRAKRPWQAKTIYKDMTNNGIVPSWATYASLLRAFCRARYAEDALKVYKEMKDKGLQLDVVLYNTLLATCANVGYIDEAVQVYEHMKGSKTYTPDSWTFSSMVTIYSCSGQITEAEGVVNDMVEAGFEPNIFVLTSLIQCYGKANRTNDVVRIFNQVLELGIIPDDRFCGCLLNVMTQTSKEELSKLVECVRTANYKLGEVVTVILEGEKSEGQFKEAASELFDAIGIDVKKPYCNSLIDLCVNLNLLDRACELLDLGVKSRIYADIQSKTPTQWSLHLKSLSLGAALTSLHVWMNDLTKAVDSGEELPPVLGINTGHGKHKYSEKGLAGVFEAHLKELNAPFHEASDMAGWFLTTEDAAKAWLESRKSRELASD